MNIAELRGRMPGLRWNLRECGLHFVVAVLDEDDAPTGMIRLRTPHGETEPTNVFWNRPLPDAAVVKLAHPRLVPRPRVMPSGTNTHPAQRPETDDFLDEAITTQRD